MKKKKIKKIAFIILPMVIVFVAIGFAINKKQNDNIDDESVVTKKKVEIQNISLQDAITAPLIVSGVIEPKQHTIIRSLTPGTIAYMVPIGEKVLVGQPLFGIMDNNIENNFFNSMQNLEQTEILSSQKISQAELGINSAEARFNLAEVQYDNALARVDQSMRITRDSAVVSYSSAYNTLNQVLNFLTIGNIEEYKFTYENIATSYSQVRNDTENMLPGVAEKFLAISYPVNKDNLADELNDIHLSLLETKKLVDNVSVLLQNALNNDAFSSTRIEGDKAIVSGYQTQVNQHVSSIISSISNLENTRINNELSLNQAQSQLDLSQIDFNNAMVILQNAEQGSVLEVNMARSQFDGASYSYNNLSIGAPFSGTVISQFFEIGDQISIGQQVIELGDLTLAEIQVAVNIDFAEAIKMGDEVLIQDKYRGIVSEIEPVGNLESGKVSVTIESDDKNLAKMSGDNIEVKFNLNYTRENTIVVPIKSVIVESTGNYVFLFEEGRVIRKAVNLGQVFGDKVVVLSGIRKEDKLILQNGIFIAEGDEVEAIER
jgi:RND family efflux transporter MFP subunit